MSRIEPQGCTQGRVLMRGMGRCILVLLAILLIVGGANANLNNAGNLTINLFDYGFYPDTGYGTSVVVNNYIFLTETIYINGSDYWESYILFKVDLNSLSVVNNITISPNIYNPTLLTDGIYLYLIGTDETCYKTYVCNLLRFIKMDINLNIILIVDNVYYRKPNSISWFYKSGYLYYQGREDGYYYAQVRKINTNTLLDEGNVTVGTAGGYYSHPVAAFNIPDTDYGLFWVGEYTGGINKIQLSNMTVLNNYLTPPFYSAYGGYVSGCPSQINNTHLFLGCGQFYRTGIQIVNLSNFNDYSFITTFTPSWDFSLINSNFYDEKYLGSPSYLYNYSKYNITGSLVDSIPLNDNWDFDVIMQRYDDNYIYVIMSDYDYRLQIYKIQYAEAPPPSEVTISCPIGWCYVASNYSSKTLLELDTLFSTDTITGRYNSTSQKYESKRAGYAFNQNVSVSQKEGMYYYFTSAQDVTMTPGTTPSITLRLGWNLVGNYQVSARTLSTLKSSIGANATQAKYYDRSLKAWVSTDSQSVPAMESFFVYVTSQTDWSG